MKINITQLTKINSRLVKLVTAYLLLICLKIEFLIRVLKKHYLDRNVVNKKMLLSIIMLQYVLSYIIMILFFLLVYRKTDSFSVLIIITFTQLFHKYIQKKAICFSYRQLLSTHLFSIFIIRYSYTVPIIIYKEYFDGYKFLQVQFQLIISRNAMTNL